MSACALVSPDARMTRASGLVLYRARNFPASPASTAAFHCSSGANAGDVLEVGCPRACLELGEGFAPFVWALTWVWTLNRSAQVTTAICEKRRTILSSLLNL